jgi:chemotaxis protein histidine kinase CheA
MDALPPEIDRLLILLGELLTERARLREIQKDLARRTHDSETCSAKLDRTLAEIRAELDHQRATPPALKLAETPKRDNAEPL